MNSRLQDAAMGRDKPRSGRSPTQWLQGRSNRKQYWLAVGPAVVALIGLALIAPAAGIIAGLAISVVLIRRFHDLGRTGWWVLALNVGCNGVAIAASLSHVPVLALAGSLLYFGAIVALGVVPGQPNDNEFGPGRRPKDLAETFS